MTLRTKAVAAALLVSLVPSLAGAQSFGIGHTGPGSWGNGSIIGVPGWTPGQQIGTPVQVADCGASHLQYLVGQPVAYVQASGIQARYFTPDSPFGTTDYNSARLNISADASYVVDRVYCG